MPAAIQGCDGVGEVRFLQTVVKIQDIEQLVEIPTALLNRLNQGVVV